MTNLKWIPALMSVALLAGCGDAAKTKWPTGRSGEDGNIDPTVFNSKSCLQNLRVTAFEKTGQRPVTLNRDVFVCSFAAETASQESKTSAMAYGADYESIAIKPSYFITSRAEAGATVEEVAAKLSTARAQKDLVVRLRLILPEGTSQSDATDIKASIAKCADKIHQAWVDSEGKVGLKIEVPVTVIGEEESSKSRAYNQKLEIIKAMSGKEKSFAMAIWPFHSEFKVKDETEPLCRSLAKLSAHWVGIPDSAAPSFEGVACKSEESLVSHPSGNALLGGFNKTEIEEETDDSNFWSKLVVREQKELKTVLQDQCQRPAKSSPVKRTKSKNVSAAVMGEIEQTTEVDSNAQLAE